MQHEHHNVFIGAIHAKQKVQVTFFSAKDQKNVTRTGAPMDFGPHARFSDKTPRYHLWDLTSPSGPHTEPLEAKHIRAIELLPETFDPADFVTWTPKWHVPRNWGAYS